MRPASRHPSPAIVLVSILALVAATGIGGCGYFHPARPENPSNGEVVTINLNSPDETLGTIRDAVVAKGLKSGDAAYRACFADSTVPATPAFHAFFAIENVNAWVSGGHLLPTDWTLKNEGTFYNVGPLSLVNLRPEAYQMTWDTTNETDTFGTNFAILHRHYQILAIGQNGDVAGTIARGYADVSLVVSATGSWVVVQWVDRVDDNPVYTWGQRRLESQSQ